ncbi:MAG TPA: HD domain-containing protein [Longimicrobiales bacterium]|nr:HD domain-containing protein [Longimicrobiales bacterium]
MRYVTIRDPLWDTIRLDATAVAIVDSPGFQRLRYIRQLGLAHLVYPGATHTRFDHAVGVYHLARRALAALREHGALTAVPEEDCALIPFAALLHDIGHYPFSHALEELEPERIPGHHEAVVGRFLAEPAVATALASLGRDAPARIEALIRGASEHPLQGLVSGSLDLDKIDYLKRDARFCGVPYGEVDVDRLLHGLLLLVDPETGRLEVGVQEKAVAALESLLFAKYQMFRNVYWHHAVRAATVMYKRIVDDALGAGLIDGAELVGQTDEGLLHVVSDRAAGTPGTRSERVRKRIADLWSRRLPKRAGELIAAELGDPVPRWLESDSAVKRRVEDAIAGELGAAAGDVYIDFPAKTEMFALDLLVRRSSGEVQRLGPHGRAGLIGLPRIAEELYRSARVLRLFVAGGRQRVTAEALAALAARSQHELEDTLARGGALLGS